MTTRAVKNTWLEFAHFIWSCHNSSFNQSIFDWLIIDLVDFVMNSAWAECNWTFKYSNTNIQMLMMCNVRITFLPVHIFLPPEFASTYVKIILGNIVYFRKQRLSLTLNPVTSPESEQPMYFSQYCVSCFDMSCCPAKTWQSVLHQNAKTTISFHCSANPSTWMRGKVLAAPTNLTQRFSSLWIFWDGNCRAGLGM